MHPSAKLSIAELRQKCRNIDYSMWIHRPARLVSIYFTKLFLILGISANMVSFFGFCLFMISFVFFVQPNPLYRGIGITIMIFAELFDYVDGELSRAYANPTKTGAFLEPFFQDVIYTLIFLAVGTSLYFETDKVIFVYLGIAAAFGKILFRLTELRYRSLLMVFSVDKTEPMFVQGFDSSGEQKFSLLSLPYRFVMYLHHYFLSGVGLIALLVISFLFSRLNIFIYFFGIMLPAMWLALGLTRIRALMALDGKSGQ